MDKSKLLGQVFTPGYISDMILDSVGYKGSSIINKTILEPSFGDGAILIKVVQRLIESCRGIGLSNDEIVDVLNNNVYGIEIDEELVLKTKNKLNLLLDLFEIENISWDNLYCSDTLKFNNKNDFDYIVGNPPYIRVHNLESDVRDSIKDYVFSVGTTDMYILFFEKCLNLLGKYGKMSFITPNSYMKNSSQGTFRKYLFENNLLSKIIDFKSSPIFKDFMVYAAITVLDKNKENLEFSYAEYNEEKRLYITKLNILDFDKDSFSSPWTFNTEGNNDLLEDIKNRSFTLDKFSTIQYGLATLRDKIYISEVKEIENDKKHVLFNNTKIEKNILRPIVKASTYDGGNIDSMIIFPYIWNVNRKIYEVMDELILSEQFPLAYKYLCDNKEELLKRDMDENAVWYQFGRSQGLNNSRYNKLIVKNVIDKDKKNLDVFELSKDIIVYSGIYITAQDDLILSKVKKVLESEEFCTYCKLVGKDMAGGWKNISSKNIKNYGITESLTTNLLEIPENFEGCTESEKDNYWDNFYKNKFLESISESYFNYLNNPRSTEKIKPIHSFIAAALQYKLGDSYIVKSDGYNLNFEKNENREQNIEGKYYCKNVDVAVSKDGVVLGAIGIKFICGNYSQNSNNYFENMIGETVNLRKNNVIYSQLLILPEFVPYYDNKGVCKKLENINTHNLEKYMLLNNEKNESFEKPDNMNIILVDTGNKKYFEKVINSGIKVDKKDKKFLKSINITYSNLDKNDYLSDDIKNYLKENSNINEFLESFICKIIEKNV